jgi:hypothetical protein
VARELSFRPLPLLITGEEREGQLVLADGKLVAVLVRLNGDAPSPELVGRWFLDTAFDPLDASGTHIFADLEQAGRWVQGQFGRRGSAKPGAILKPE